MRTASSLDDVARVVGYTATRILAAWYHGRNLYVPTSMRDGHPLEVLIGRSCMRALVREYAGQVISIPTRHQDRASERERAVVEGVLQGRADSEIAAVLGITPERVGQIRRAVAGNGLLDYARLEPEKIFESGGLSGNRGA